MTTLNWNGQVITTTANPQRLAPANPNRNAWRAYNLSGATGRIGYNQLVAQAYIPMPVDASYPVTSDDPVESNELWYHGATGAVIGFAES